MTESPWLLVLGANSDMAIATAKRYAQAGYNLYLASRNLEECEKNAADIRLRYKIEVQALQFDAQDFSTHANFYAGLVVKPKGALVAFGFMAEQQLAQADFSLAKAMIDTNYTGAVSILEIIAADFEQRQSGFIVGISSVAGDRGRMSNYIYGSTKAAFSAYLAGLRHRLIKSKVLVLTVKPGFVATKMTADLDLPAKLTAKPEQVGNAIFNAVEKKKSTIYVKPIWCLIMLIIVHLPNFVFYKTKM
ncbi:MAG: SDR family oxidoreductase [Methyloprofundus sp.]|nr:SDR family oxidoreductase [Methyloprofundus sp.]